MNKARLLYPTYGAEQKALYEGRVSDIDARQLSPAQARRTQRRRENQRFREEQKGQAR